MNFVYAFDNNYDVQGFVAIKSLLDNVSKNICIYIIHKDPDSFQKYYKELESHENLDSITIHKFNSDDLIFPNIENKHVSEATYYRLYLNKYLPKNLETLIYLDSDILCLNDPIPYLTNVVKKINSENCLLAARSEHIKNVNNNYLFKNLNLNSINYFNAGVLVMNYKKWIEEEVYLKLQNAVLHNEVDLMWWDQDILNKVIDGNFIDLNYFLNFKLSLDWKVNEQYLNDEVIFLHYQGKLKPWTISGLLGKHSKLYQEIYLDTDIANDKYHLIKENSIIDLLVLVKSIFNFRIFNLKNPVAVILKVISNVING